MLAKEPGERPTAVDVVESILDVAPEVAAADSDPRGARTWWLLAEAAGDPEAAQLLAGQAPGAQPASRPMTSLPNRSEPTIALDGPQRAEPWPPDGSVVRAIPAPVQAPVTRKRRTRRVLAYSAGTVLAIVLAWITATVTGWPPQGTPAADSAASFSTRPVRVALGTETQDAERLRIAVGDTSACVITEQGVARCWGSNSSGQLGSPGGDSAVPRDVDTTGVLKGVTLERVVIGHEHACALDEAGRMYCWGVELARPAGRRGSRCRRIRDADARGREGGPGPGAEPHRHRRCVDLRLGHRGLAALLGRQRHRAGRRRVADLAGHPRPGGHDRRPARQEDQPVRGGRRPHLRDRHGRLAVLLGQQRPGAAGHRSGEAGRLAAPARRRGGRCPAVRPPCRQRADCLQHLDTGHRLHADGDGDGAGAERTVCSISTQGIVYCWGDNSRGQLGSGTTQGESIPVAVTDPVEGPLPRFVRVAAGPTASCAVGEDGSAWCWGSDAHGLLGKG